MPAATSSIEELLDPIPMAGMPAGMDMRWTPEWDRLREARRSDDDLETGRWQKRERKTADWHTVQNLASTMLRERTKDLQVSMWLTEANVKLNGFDGLRDGLHVVRELMQRYWNQGLFPALEDGPEDRSGPFEWMNSKLVDSIRAVPITARNDGGRDYTIIDWEDARRVGSEKSCLNPEGEVDPVRRRAYDQAIADGHVSLEMFERAVTKTERPDFETLASAFQQAWDQFKALEKSVDEHFGDVAPNLATSRNAMDGIRQAVLEILENRRKASPDSPSAMNAQQNTGDTGGPITMRFNLPIPAGQEATPALSRSWENAENLVRSGNVEKGLAEMCALAAAETSGRSRFHRKLLLAQACLNVERTALARSILEELAEQIDKLQLEQWESSELIAAVWMKLSGIYKQTEDSDLQDRARQYVERLCRLDPWQALKCGGV